MAWHTAIRDNFLISQNVVFEYLKPFKISFKRNLKKVSNISSFVLLGWCWQADMLILVFLAYKLNS